jgi:hypothetical protein
MKQIEFFGLPGSGKTYLKNLLKKKYRNIEILSYRDILIKYLFYEESNIIKKYIIKFYLNYQKIKKNNLLNSNNKRTQQNNKILQILKIYFFNIYLKNLDLTFKKYENKKFIKLTKKLIKNSNFSENNKVIIRRWSKEEITAKYLIQKNKIDCVVDSEGFIQRLFVYAYKKNNKEQIIREYLRSCPLPEYLFITKKKIIKKKLSSNVEFNLDIAEQIKIYDIVLKQLKNKITIHTVDKSSIKNLAI